MNNDTTSNTQVYIITDGEYYKIGSSYNPVKRLKELQTGNARLLRIVTTIDLGLLPDIANYSKYQDVYNWENHIHRHMNNYKVLNEWFKCPEDVTEPQFIAEIWLIIHDAIKNWVELDIKHLISERTQLRNDIESKKKQLNDDIINNIIFG